ncbi:MAG: ABC transporter substrate-binding protein [Alphaproteobacteria bacterium]|nr:ABC transporter substrate-binding protein [Alphaproteobacteria bacterium]
MKRRIFLVAASSFAMAVSFGAMAADPIKVGFPMILSGPGALFGEPALKGAQMYVEEVNAKGGVLGRKIQLISRDTKGNADEAVRVVRELILREDVNFIVGTLTSAEGPAVSPIAKENKIVFVAPITKTDQLTAPANLHPYVFRSASTTTIEGRTAAEIVAKWPVTRIATISPDYAYGQDVTKAFVEHLKKIKPSVEIVDQQWPKLGEADYTPFINAQLAKRPEAVFSSLWGGHFVTFAKQAKPLNYFQAINNNFIGAGEAASIESTKSMGADYPVGIWGNSYDVFDWPDGPQSHKDYIARLKKFTNEEHPSSWPITGYIAMQFLTAAIAKAGSIDSDKVSAAMKDISVDTPLGKMTMRAKDHQANHGQFWGKTKRDPKYPFAVIENVTRIDPAPFMD